MIASHRFLFPHERARLKLTEIGMSLKIYPRTIRHEKFMISSRYSSGFPQ